MTTQKLHKLHTSYHISTKVLLFCQSTDNGVTTSLSTQRHTYTHQFNIYDLE